MCGIVGCILKEEEDVAPILFDCISKLEYRGYDSIGLATFAEGNIHIKKDKGKIVEVDNKLDLTDMLKFWHCSCALGNPWRPVKA